MVFKTVDEKIWYAENLEELAFQLWRSQFLPPETMEEWMRENSRRAMIWNNSPLRWDTIQNHMDDMLKAGFVQYESKPATEFKLKLVK